MIGKSKLLIGCMVGLLVLGAATQLSAQAPVQTYPTPGQTVGVSITLTWGSSSALYPAGTTYDINLGTTATPPAAAGGTGLSTASYTTPAPLNANVPYYWQVIVHLPAAGGAAAPAPIVGPIWTFNTSSNPPSSTSQDASDILKSSFGFGVALGLSTNVTAPNIVNSATVDANGMVRVNTRANTDAGFMLESHYLIWPTAASACVSQPLPKNCKGVQQSQDNRWWGTGPFVAAQPGSSQIISSVGAGWMISFRRPKGTTPSGFGLGVGYEAIPAAQVLGSEFVPGQKAPLGPNGQPLSIRYETQDKGALLFVLSVSF
jgi:hypothetical protein